MQQRASARVNPATFEELTEELLQWEATLREITETKRRIPHMERDPPKRRKTAKDGGDDSDKATEDKQPNQKTWQPDTIQLRANGKIHIDADNWRQIKKEWKDWVIRYNRSVNHQEPSPDPPSPIRILPAESDQSDNSGETAEERTRRVMETLGDDELEEEDASPDNVQPGIDFGMDSNR